MANLVVRVKIMPKEANIRPQQIKDDLKNKLGGIEIRRTNEEPIAFGLVALIADFSISDESGQMEKLEEILKSCELVGEFEVTGLSRMSAELRR